MKLRTNYFFVIVLVIVSINPCTYFQNIFGRIWYMCVMSIIICLLVTFLRVTETCIWNRIFMLSQIYASIGSFLPQPMKQRSWNLLQLLWKSFLCGLFFPNDWINYVPIYMKINHIFFVIKGQFPVMDYIPNTIILYFIVYCIYVLCLFYCITCFR